MKTLSFMPYNNLQSKDIAYNKKIQCNSIQTKR